MHHRTRQRRQLLAPLTVGLLIQIVCGCSLPLQSARLDQWEAAGRPVELESVPFFPQEKYQCGPAALATVLNHSGVAVTPDELRDYVYLPEREGSLQVEILAAARRYGRVPYVLRPKLEDLLAELQAAHPVLVLQNLALSWYPRWHYAVVIGYEPLQRRVVLRSGTIERHTIPIELFERTWRRSDYWAVLMLRPGELPATADEQRFLEAIVPLERLHRWADARHFYQTALAEWPDNFVALMGLGNSSHALGDVQGAISAFQRAVERHPAAAAAHNNLAFVLAELGRLQEAEVHSQRAVELSNRANPEYIETLTHIRSRM